MSSNSPGQKRGNRQSNKGNRVFAVRGQAGYKLTRLARPAAKQGDGKGKYFPVWYVKIKKPGESELNTSSSKWVPGGAVICVKCAASDEGPLARKECACQKPLRKLIENELGLAIEALHVTLAEGRVEQYRALIAPKHPTRPTATVQDVIDAVEGIKGGPNGELWKRPPGPVLWSDSTWAAYRAALLRMASIVDAKEPRAVLLADVLTAKIVDAVQCTAQKAANRDALNLVDRLDENGSANATVRNVRALFSDKAMMRLFHHLSMPLLSEFRAVPYLKTPVTGFMPWPVETWRAFVEASEALRSTRPDLWEVNAWLRRTGLRDAELLAARRFWIEETASGPVLVITDRAAGFSLLKKGKGRRIGIDAELFELVKDLPPDEPLVGRGIEEWRRYDLIYREHNAFVREFIPDRRKANHEMRMMAGSVVYEKRGLQAAADFLGHKRMDTTRDFYATPLAASEALTARDVDRL